MSSDTTAKQIDVFKRYSAQKEVNEKAKVAIERTRSEMKKLVRWLDSGYTTKNQLGVPGKTFWRGEDDSVRYENSDPETLGKNIRALQDGIDNLQKLGQELKEAGIPYLR